MSRTKSKSLLALLGCVFIACLLLLLSNNTQTVFADDDEKISVSAQLVESAPDVFYLSISVNNAVGGTAYDIWAKKEVALHESALNTTAVIWAKQVQTTDSSSHIYDYEDMQINGYYEIYVKGASDTESLYSKIAVSSTQPHIESLTINGNPLAEVNYLAAGVNAEFVFDGNAEGYTLKDGNNTYTDTNGEIAYKVRNGEYSVYVKADGGEYTEVVLHGYNAVESYTVIENVTINSSITFGESVYMGDTANISLTTNPIGDGSTVFARVKVNGESYNFTDGLNTQFKFTDYFLTHGVYTLAIELVNSSTGLVEDSYVTYYNYSRYYGTENRASFTPVFTLNSNDSYDFTITDIQSLSANDLYFRILKWDIRGEYVIHGWTLYTGQVDDIIKLNDQGNYVLETQVKVGVSGKTFEARNYSHFGSVQSANNELIITSALGEPVSGDYYARTPYMLKVDSQETAQMYKYVVSGKGFYYREEFFTPSNNFVWIANKGGTYNISVRLLGTDNYGYAEKIINKEIIVKYGDEYAVNFANPENGTITVMSGSTPITSGTEVRRGTAITISFAAAYGYESAALMVNSSPFTSGSTHIVTDTVNISAQSVAISYEIKYNLPSKAVAGNNAPATYTIEDEIALAAPTMDGYIFDGWYDNSSLSGNAINNTSEVVLGDLTLWAKWDINYNGFEGEVGTLPSGITAVTGAGVALITTADKYSGEKAMLFDDRSGTLSSVQVNGGGSSFMTFETMFKPSSGGLSINFRNASNANILRVHLATSGKVQYYNGSAWVDIAVGTVIPNAWNYLKVDINTNAIGFNVTLNDSIATVNSLLLNTVPVGRVILESVTTDGTAQCYFDEMALYEYVPEISYGFENADTSRAMIGNKSSSLAKVSTEQKKSGDASLMIYDNSSSSNELVVVPYRETSTMTVEFAFYADEIVNGISLWINSGINWIFWIHFYENGSIGYYNGSHVSEAFFGAGTIEMGQWYDIKVVVDMVSGTAQVIFDGEASNAAQCIRSGRIETTVNNIAFMSGSTPGTGDKAYIDDLIMYQYR